MFIWPFSDKKTLISSSRAFKNLFFFAISWLLLLHVMWMYSNFFFIIIIIMFLLAVYADTNPYSGMLCAHITYIYNIIWLTWIKNMCVVCSTCSSIILFFKSLNRLFSIFIKLFLLFLFRSFFCTLHCIHHVIRNGSMTWFHEK